ncbi:TetR/AcrR family transcriptional regulator [Rhodococcus ruber]|uniref:TetR/AcrR family transcriptional regulator n=1 Tax=Rhodococcus ruber TaxID=1830 RepID=UPI001F1F3543|nr:TetR/AcrR family transcriptional regulator [Rhodococcus ruber]
MLRATADDGGKARLSPRELRKQQRIALSRAQILDTAEELFAEYGYHETGLKDVAARCEFSVGSIYTLFPSKESLYEEVLLRYYGDAQWEKTQRIAPPSMPSDERLIALAEMQMETIRQHPAWSAVHADALRIAMIRSAVLPERFMDEVRRSYAYVQKIIEDGQRQGLVPDGDPGAMAKLYFTLVNALTTTNASTGEPNTDSKLFLSVIRRAFTTQS